jgi:hypothetical protein
MPNWIAHKKRRGERIRQAKAELEAEARAAAEAKLKASGRGANIGAKPKGARRAAPRSTTLMRAAPPLGPVSTMGLFHIIAVGMGSTR